MSSRKAPAPAKPPKPAVKAEKPKIVSKQVFSDFAAL